MSTFAATAALPHGAATLAAAVNEQLFRARNGTSVNCLWCDSAHVMVVSGGPAEGVALRCAGCGSELADDGFGAAAQTGASAPSGEAPARATVLFGSGAGELG